jgi:hypothetical protein
VSRSCPQLHAACRALTSRDRRRAQAATSASCASSSGP